VDRAQDRDGKTDKLWVTSQKESGIGTELTVARTEDSTVAGTSATSDRTSTTERDTAQRDVASRGETASATKTPKATTEAASGTSGRIAKFTSGTDLGNSVLTELNGNIGVGTTSPITKFHILSGANDKLPPRLQSSGTTSFAAGWDFYHGTTGKGYVGVPNSAAGLASGEMLMYGATGVKTSLWAGGIRSVTLDTTGNVGIGTSNPFGNLEIAGYSPFITLRETQQGRNEPTYIQNAGGSLVFKPLGSGYNTAAMVMQANTLNVGIGSTDPKAKLEVVSGSGDILRLIGYSPFITLFDSHNGYAPTYIQNAGGSLVFKPTGFGSCCAAMVMQANTGNIGIGTATPQAKLDVTGRTRTESLEITGGADFAENFDVSAVSNEAAELKIEAGMVVAIDPINPGKLTLSTKAYNRRVAGIISGAGGVNPGMRMSQAGTLADGQHPVALSGRVYCWVDATQSAVRAGDLLTTSTTPGYAMKVTNRTKAQGAILGKALTGLKSGKGLILVLVTLQ
jgi:hypothetical protein